MARRALHGSVPPRVLHAVLISWLNGWCTARRFQGPRASCRLCADCDGTDELEHYACCPFLWSSLPAWSCIPHHPRSLRRFLLLEPGEGDQLAALATVVFAAYGAFNLARCQGARLTRTALRLTILERFRTAMQSSSALRHLWPSPPTHRRSARARLAPVPRAPSVSEYRLRAADLL